MDLLERAFLYAAEAHRRDRRKGTGTPYVAHLLAVASIVLEHGGDEEQAAAGFLHDVAEDHGGEARLADVRTTFGDGVADIVRDLSDSLVDTTTGAPKEAWLPRKARYIRHLEDVPERSLLVTAADKLHNSRALLTDHRQLGPALWQRFSAPDAGSQLWYHRRVSSVIARRLRGSLAEELVHVVNELEALVATEVPDLRARLAELDGAAAAVS